MHHLIHILLSYSYWGLFVGLAIEYFFIPIPGETTLTTAGILWHRPDSHLSLLWLIVSTAGGTFTGSMIAYILGRTVGRPLLEFFAKLIRLKPERLNSAERMFKKYTVPTLFVSRYIAVVRILVPYLAGINRVPILLYIVTMLVGSLAWTSTFILAGSVIAAAGSQVLHHWKQELAPAIVAAIVLLIGYYYLHRWLKAKMESESPDEEDSAPDKKDGTR